MLSQPRTRSPGTRRSWRCCRGASGCRWPALCGTWAGTCAWSSGLSGPTHTNTQSFGVNITVFLWCCVPQSKTTCRQTECVDADHPAHCYWCCYNYCVSRLSVISAGQREKPDQATHVVMRLQNHRNKKRWFIWSSLHPDKSYKCSLSFIWNVELEQRAWEPWHTLYLERLSK